MKLQSGNPLEFAYVWAGFGTGLVFGAPAAIFIWLIGSAILHIISLPLQLSNTQHGALILLLICLIGCLFLNKLLDFRKLNKQTRNKSYGLRRLLGFIRMQSAVALAYTFILYGSLDLMGLINLDSIIPIIFGFITWILLSFLSFRLYDIMLHDLFDNPKTSMFP